MTPNEVFKLTRVPVTYDRAGFVVWNALRTSFNTADESNSANKKLKLDRELSAVRNFAILNLRKSVLLL